VLTGGGGPSRFGIVERASTATAIETIVTRVESGDAYARAPSSSSSVTPMKSRGRAAQRTVDRA
jgi:hypothetical protein